MLQSSDRLTALYSSFKPGDSEAFKKSAKQKMINAIVLGVYKLPLYKKKNYFRYSLQAFRKGNAFFMAFSRYDSQYDVFEKEFEQEYHSNLKSYLDGMKKKYPSL